MTQPSSDSIRNVVLASYAGAGKTSLAEALAYSAGAIPSMGSISTGNTIGDFEPEEVHHHHSMSTALLRLDLKDCSLNILDTPGSLDFFADTKASIHVADGAILVIGASGLRSEVERVWDIIQERGIPSLIFVNELDKEHTNFDAILEEISKTLEINCIPIALPLGQQADLEGAIDLLRQKAITPVANGHKVQEIEIPDNLTKFVAEARKKLIECAAEGSDELLEKYLGEGELTEEEILEGLKLGVGNQSFVPVLCGAATKNIGTTLLTDAILHLLPSPQEQSKRKPVTGRNPQTEEEQVVPLYEEDPFSAYVFKTTIDPFMGRLTYIKVQSGVLEADSHFYNSVRHAKEKGGHLYRLLGKKTTQIDRVSAGDIVAIAKLKDTQTGDTICADKHTVILPGVKLTRPVMAFALETKNNGDIDKVSLGLHKLVEEDPSLEFFRNDETKEMLLSGVGQTHIEFTLEKLHRKYGVDVNLHTPKVAYRETIQATSQAQGKYKKQTGGHGQYGDCWLQLDPLPRGGGFEFVNKIVGGVIPRNFIPAVEKGVVEAMHDGLLAGFPVVDIQVTVYDGSHHPVDSSEMAFKVAGSMGFKKAMESAHPVLLEPIMQVEVTAPDELVGAVIGDLNSRRGRILGMDVKGHNQIVKALVPLAEILKYAPALTSITAGKGSYVMEFSGYEQAPREVMTKVVEEHMAAKQAVAG
ncbi:elongation factor G [Candidatus Nitronereus thalassa]|uniref:Elongation factor G n=1 Tax=Candidatus Nitronereus thalassa TaxID=3020898 RepID=A0ABU3K424_9BACT|nr:elongation factor G [Candidatus Nitronereus thalassa]MDT7041140.1 elongation factor G [Candidatus Nitronereus thalassa]